MVYFLGIRRKEDSSEVCLSIYSTTEIVAVDLFNIPRSVDLNV